MLSSKIFTNLHIIMYVLILDFQLVVDGGGGGGGEMFTYILDKSCNALSVLLGGPQSCCLQSDSMIIVRLLKAVLHNRSTSPLVSAYNVFVQHNNANIYPIDCIYPGCNSRKNTLQSFVTMDLHSYFGVASSSSQFLLPLAAVKMTHKALMLKA